MVIYDCKKYKARIYLQKILIKRAEKEEYKMENFITASIKFEK